MPREIHFENNAELFRGKLRFWKRLSAEELEITPIERDYFRFERDQSIKESNPDLPLEVLDKVRLEKADGKLIGAADAIEIVKTFLTNSGFVGQ